MASKGANGRRAAGDGSRRALVTGAAGGIGGAVLSHLIERGMRALGLDLDPGGRPGVLACDVTQRHEVEWGVKAVLDELGGLDALVNVVGSSGRRFGDGPVHECTEEAWDRVLDTNLRSVFLVSRAVLPHLGRGSSIVNVSSVLGLLGGEPEFFETHAYAASKGALVSLTRAMAVSYAERGIRVNAVAPGLVRTGMSRRAQANPQLLAYTAKRQVLTGPLLEPQEVACVIGFLSSAEAAAITGVVLPVDGGWTAS